MNRFIVFLCLLLSLESLSGQQAAQDDQEPPIRGQTLEEVVVSAFNASRRLLVTPGSLTMISARQIEQQNAPTILPLMNLASGVYAHSGTISTSRITIRGIGARVPYGTGKIRAYFNNIPLTNGSGLSIVEYIDPAVIGRIEIIKGPATSAYGAGLGGTIILTARQPMLQDAGVNNSFRAGSWGLLNNSLILDAGSANLASSLMINRAQSDGFRQNDSYRRNALTSVTQLQAGARTRGTLLVYFADMKGYIPSSIDSLTFVNNPQAAAQNWLQTKGYNDTQALLAGASVNHQLNRSLAFDMSLFTTLHNEKERRPFDFLYEDRTSGGTRLKTTWMRRTGLAQWQLMAGGELFLENFRYRNNENIDGLGQQGAIISRNREWISYYNLFIQADLEYARFNVSAGLNAHTNRIHYHDLKNIDGIDRSAVYDYGVIWSPRISANYRVHTYHAVFATVSHGFSPPSLAETLTPDGFINPDIRPEKSWNYEAGLRGSFLTNRWFYDLSLYSMDVKDLLVAQRVGEDAWVGKNAGRSLHQGLELELQGVIYQPDKTTGDFWQVGEVSVRGALSLNDFRFTRYVDQGNDYSGNSIPGIPSHFLNGGLQVRLTGGLYAEASTRWAGRMPMNDANSRTASPYAVAGLTAGYQHGAGSWDLDLFVQAGNLFDAHYASMILVNAPSFGNAPPRYYYPGTPRHFSVGLRLGYHPRKGNKKE